jgi:Tfp pilus assembly protein PilO
MTSSNRIIVAMLAVVVLAGAFWVLLLSPKREEAAQLGEQIEQAETSLAQHQSEIDAAEAARKQFPVDYQKLVVLGKAVPASDETASLLVQVSGIAKHAGVRFQDIALSGEGSSEEAPPPATGGASVSPTEAAASLLPLGATIGPAGLAAMPYTLTFEGSFFQIANFIKGLDAMVKTSNENVTVDGRLITVDSFTLSGGEGEAGSSPGSPDALSASFNVTTYLTPPGEGVAAGALPEVPSEPSATPAAATTGGAP